MPDLKLYIWSGSLMAYALGTIAILAGNEDQALELLKVKDEALWRSVCEFEPEVITEGRVLTLWLGA